MRNSAGNDHGDFVILVHDAFSYESLSFWGDLL